MRGSPPCEVALRRFGLWRAGVVLIGSAVLATLCAWATLVPQGPSSARLVAIAAIAAAATLALCASLWRTTRGVLSWDGLGWAFAPDSKPDEPTPGRLTASIDLGVFMLLHFVPLESARRWPGLWLPAQRRGLEREWHSFRCAVYSPRPVAGIADADAPAP